MYYNVSWHAETSDQLDALVDTSLPRDAAIEAVAAADALRRFQPGPWDQPRGTGIRCMTFGPLDVFFVLDEAYGALQIVHVRHNSS